MFRAFRIYHLAPTSQKVQMPKMSQMPLRRKCCSQHEVPNIRDTYDSSTSWPPLLGDACTSLARLRARLHRLDAGGVPWIACSALASCAFGKHDGLLQFLIDDRPPTTIMDATTLNLCVWFPSVCGAYTLSHAATRFKFNPEHPPLSFLIVEMGRSVGGMVIAAAWEVVLLRTGSLAVGSLAVSDLTWHTFLMFLLYWLPPLTLWLDGHFYAIHRLLHDGALHASIATQDANSHAIITGGRTPCILLSSVCLAVPFLYKTVHKMHHQSVNPDAFSGHSMHPVEQLLFFSSFALCLLVPMPYWVFRLMKWVVLLAPLAEHMGTLTGHRHYLHHKFFSFNYGEDECYESIPDSDASSHECSR